MENLKNFVAIDVETANKEGMICQIGIVVVKDGVKSAPMTWYVQPPGNKYDRIQMLVHHITPEHTKESPFFDEVWEQVKVYLVGQTLVAHNRNTEVNVLNKHFKEFGILPMGINMDIICTCEMHGGRGLEDVCQAYGMSFDGHHNAGFDADCCAQFYLNKLNRIEPDYSLVEKKEKNKKLFGRKDRLRGDDYKMDLSNADPNSPFYQRKVVITGDFSIDRKVLGKLLRERLGADIDSNISKKTNFVFIGKDPGWEKIPKLDKLIHDGFNIRKLYESDLQAILNGDWEGYHMEKEIKKNLDFTYSHFTKHRVMFQNGRNVIAGKELYYGKGLSGDCNLFAQITGNLGACGDYDIYTETNLCVLSDSTLDKLQLGEKDETILYIQDYYNSGRANTFDMQFISEGEILRFVKERIKQTDDKILECYYKRYIGEVDKTI